MNEPEAELVVLKKAEPQCLEFHRYLLRVQLSGQKVKVGDRIMVYEVVQTVPNGLVKVTSRTHFEFRT